MTARETIYALASGQGRAAIAVLRLSGPETGVLLDRIASPRPAPRTFSLRRIVDPRRGEVVDEAIVVWLPAPQSFTGEDSAELHLHASPAVLSAVMGLLAAEPGVRAADPGEFTRRAFSNGKMDLVEVEGLADLLEARTAGQRRQAFRQMSGEASSVFARWREELLMIRAEIEATVDFADEAGVAEEAGRGLEARMLRLRDEMVRAVQGSVAAEIMREGVRVVLAGLPNTGKSSLLNLLAKREAAIVSDVPGTTRDAIEVSLDIGGIPVILTDTAGLRDAADPVEKEGIRRSHRRLVEADVVIWVWSRDVAGSGAPGEGITPDLVVENKVDLLPVANPSIHQHGVLHLALSTRTQIGLEELLLGLGRLLAERFGLRESAVIASVRQRQVAERSIRMLNDALETASGHPELRAEEVRRASDEVGRLTGRVDVEDWLGAIFSRFCIGK